MLAYAAWWLGVFMPGHQRGEVKVAGAGDDAAICANCPKPQEQAPDTPPVESSACCAVCYLVAGLDTPPVVDLTVAALGLLDELSPIAIVAQRTTAPPLSHLFGRAPPRTVA